MEAQSPSGTPSAAYPRWVMLEKFSARDSAGDAKTLAAARTTAGYKVEASLLLAAPPAASSVCVQVPANVVEHKHFKILAAHGDSVLIQATLKYKQGYYHETYELFVYYAGAAAANPTRPPSLLLLPPYYLTEEEKEYFLCRPKGPIHRYFESEATGLIRRGMDEIVVAELKMVEVSKDTLKNRTAEILMPCNGEWSINRPLISGINCEGWDLPSSWCTDMVITVSDRLLCWVDLCRGLLFLDIIDKSSGLQYVSLPEEPCFGRARNRNVCVTAGGVLKFVNIFPRCCCGSAGATECRHSSNAYIIRTWTVNLDDMAWVMDSMVDSTELQTAFDSYKDLPSIQLAYPVVSLDEPHVICFLLCEAFHVNGGDDNLWLIMFNMKSKMVQSVSLYPGRRWQFRGDTLRPSRVSYYLNSFSNTSSSGSSDDEHNGQTDVELSPRVIVDNKLSDDASKSVPRSSPKSSVKPPIQASEIVAALEEMPSYGLPRNDMLKAYSILVHDSGRRCRTLLGLPMSLRKEWLSMEIKNSEA